MSFESQNNQSSVATMISPAQGPLRRGSHTYDLMRQCIHCGFCLPTCPTYAVLGVEMDSPRGRIYQMQALAEGRLEISPEFVDHMYCCLGCRACETACPSGVQFGKLIEAAREQIQIEASNIPIFSIQNPAGSETTGDDESQLDYASTERDPLKLLTNRALRLFFFDFMLPSRTITSLIFALLKIYQRSGLQTFIRRTR